MAAFITLFVALWYTQTLQGVVKVKDDRRFTFVIGVVSGIALIASLIERQPLSVVAAALAGFLVFVGWLVRQIRDKDDDQKS